MIFGERFIQREKHKRKIVGDIWKHVRRPLKEKHAAHASITLVCLVIILVLLQGRMKIVN